MHSIARDLPVGLPSVSFSKLLLFFGEVFRAPHVRRSPRKMVCTPILYRVACVGCSVVTFVSDHDNTLPLVRTNVRRLSGGRYRSVGAAPPRSYPAGSQPRVYPAWLQVWRPVIPLMLCDALHNRTQPPQASGPYTAVTMSSVDICFSTQPSPSGWVLDRRHLALTITFHWDTHRAGGPYTAVISVDFLPFSLS